MYAEGADGEPLGRRNREACDRCVRDRERRQLLAVARACHSRRMEDMEFDIAVNDDVVDDAFDSEAAADLARAREAETGHDDPAETNEGEDSGWAALDVDSDDAANPYLSA